ncbi:hypothetical protein NMY22_g12507 [Coprinellus aureogranulatus]|nr:hypothetical protein NMY22_g12507 [Coprinellus aureogranulatus]
MASSTQHPPSDNHVQSNTMTGGGFAVSGSTSHSSANQQHPVVGPAVALGPPNIIPGTSIAPYSSGFVTVNISGGPAVTAMGGSSDHVSLILPVPPSQRNSDNWDRNQPSGSNLRYPRGRENGPRVHYPQQAPEPPTESANILPLYHSSSRVVDSDCFPSWPSHAIEDPIFDKATRPENFSKCLYLRDIIDDVVKPILHARYAHEQVQAEKTANALQPPPESDSGQASSGTSRKGRQKGKDTEPKVQIPHGSLRVFDIGAPSTTPSSAIGGKHTSSQALKATTMSAQIMRKIKTQFEHLRLVHMQTCHDHCLKQVPYSAVVRHVDVLGMELLVLRFGSGLLRDTFRETFQVVADARDFDAQQFQNFTEFVTEDFSQFLWIFVIQLNGKQLVEEINGWYGETCSLTKKRICPAACVPGFSDVDLATAGPGKLESNLGNVYDLGALYLDYYLFDSDGNECLTKTFTSMQWLRDIMEEHQRLGGLTPPTENSKSIWCIKGYIAAMTTEGMKMSSQAFYETIMGQKGGEEVLKKVLEDGREGLQDDRRPDRVIWLMAGSLTNLMVITYLAGELGNISYDVVATLKEKKYEGLRASIHLWVVKFLLVFQAEYPGEYMQAARTHLQWLEGSILENQHYKPGRSKLAVFVKAIHQPTGEEGVVVPGRPRHRRQNSDPALPGDILTIAASKVNPEDIDTNEVVRLMTALSLPHM